MTNKKRGRKTGIGKYSPKVTFVSDPEIIRWMAENLPPHKKSYFIRECLRMEIASRSIPWDGKYIYPKAK